jgi:SAM-dependent methyltransferase
MDLSAVPDHLALLDAIVDRPPLTDPAVVPEKIPWDDPAFSERMLNEHLDQGHDMASRRLDTIDRHIAWILETVMEGKPGQVLDIGCGPGLYTERLAARGCTCLGVDFSPASVRHARATSAERGSACLYVLGDVRTTDLGEGHDTALLLFGEFNVFDRAEAADLLSRVGRALRPGGRLVLEPQPEGAVRAAGAGSPTWFATRSGLFSPEPHLVLTEHAWDDTAGCTLTRHLVVDAATASVVAYGERVYAYSVGDYRAVLTAAGFVDVQIHDGFGATTQPGTIVVTARTPSE